jgi:hypothetical protein
MPAQAGIHKHDFRHCAPMRLRDRPVKPGDDNDA